VSFVEMKIFNRIKDFYSTMRIRTKLLLLFMIFGFFIAYLTFILSVITASIELRSAAFSTVEKLVSRNSSPDVIESFIGKKYNRAMISAIPFLALEGYHEGDLLNIKSISFYLFEPSKDAWYMIFFDKNDILIKEEVTDKAELFVLNEALKKKTSFKDYLYWGNNDSYSLWFNLTGSADRNFYLLSIIVQRKGIVEIGGIFLIAGSFIIFIASFLSARIFSYYMAIPILKLKSQASSIASGNFDLRIDIRSRDEIGELSLAINTMAEEIKLMIDELNSRMSAISTMNKIDRAVLSSLSRFSLVENVTAIVSELFTDLEVFLAMADEDNKRYHVLVGNNLARRSESVNSFYVDFEKLGEEIIAGNYYFYSLSHEENEDVLSELNSLFGTEYFYMMNIPIYIEETYVASLVLGREKDVPFTDFETDTSIAIADQVGVAMKSLRYIERIESLFLGILKALSKTIDAKSKWTYGHSERVAKYSEAIARAMNLNDEFIHNITISASLHDIGKIGVSENILDKRGTLTSEEFGAIKNHPVEGAEILEVIPGYEKFISGIIYHHEHYDGNGYPFGLKEEEIPLMGRIIAVADVFDSLVSDRPYRKGMSVEEAKEILKQERGKKLDPAIVDIILQIV